MGGSSNPIKAITKAVNDTVNTASKAVSDTTNTVVKAHEDGFNTLKDGANDTIKLATLGAADGQDILDEAGRVASGRIVLDPFAKQTEAGKDEARQAQRDADAAQRDQEASRQDQLRQSAANKDATRGSSIILGGKKKKKGKGSVSNGLGLSTGDTGLQT